MLKQQSHEEWRMCARAVPISEALRLLPEGLVLGAGTVLIAAESARRLQSLKGQEVRLLALLSAAYGRAVSVSVLGNIERATKAWNEGDDCLAYMHLVHTGLGPLHDFRRAAYRLFAARGAMMHGASSRAVFEALRIDARYIEAVGKLYNPEQPRVPAGSGRTSGEWTRVLSWIAGLDAAQLAELGAYAARLLGPAGAAVAAFGMLFIPSPDDVHVEGEVPEIPGLRYSWNRDEAQLHLTYDNPDGGQRTFSAYIDGDVFRDEQGDVIGRVVGGNMVAIDAAAVSSDLVNQDQPKLCPAPAPDVAGSDQGKPYEENKARQYEDYVKAFINPPPDGPTPSGFVYYLPNPEQDGEPVSYDDCQKKTGILLDYKGEGYAQLLQNPITKESIKEGFLDQALRQVQASDGRPIIWIFADQEAATYAGNLFQNDDRLKGIYVVWVPWVK